MKQNQTPKKKMYNSMKMVAWHAFLSVTLKQAYNPSELYTESETNRTVLQSLTVKVGQNIQQRT